MKLESSNASLALGAFLMAAAVCAGAFGAHALRDRLEPYYMDVFQKAVFYHFIHALGLLIVGILAQQQALAAESASRIALMLLVGILFFSGSLYALALTQVKMLGAITPIGGASFILAWLYLTYCLLSSKTNLG